MVTNIVIITIFIVIVTVTISNRCLSLRSGRHILH